MLTVKSLDKTLRKIDTYPLWLKTFLRITLLNVGLLLLSWSPCLTLGFFNGEICTGTGFALLFLYFPIMAFGEQFIRIVIDFLVPIIGDSFYTEMIGMSVVGFIGYLLITIIISLIVYLWTVRK